MPGIVNIDVGSVMSGIGTLAKDLRAAITGKEPINAEKAAELALKVQELEQRSVEAENTLVVAQAEISKVEASSSRFWVSGARPFIIWIGGVVIAYVYIITPLLKAAGVAAPEVNLNELWPVITSVLGLGAYRTYEKVKGVA